jgi:hypothetical protein
MTPEQEHVFCRAASLGVALGLNHRYEWFINAQRALMHGSYDEIPNRRKELDDAFLAFERSTASCPEEEVELQKLTITAYSHKVADYYAQAGR